MKCGGLPLPTIATLAHGPFKYLSAFIRLIKWAPSHWAPIGSRCSFYLSCVCVCTCLYLSMANENLIPFRLCAARNKYLRFTNTAQ